MKLLSVNVSLPKEITDNRGRKVMTSIFKEPVNGRVLLRKLHLDGDGQADLKGHGGVNRAVYVYSIENYDYWKQELGGNNFTHAQFGENFTVDGMLEDGVYIGDIFRVGSALVQVTQPRVPCFKLGLKMNLDKFPKLFLASGRVGFYLRVLQEGEVGAGDVIDRVKLEPHRVTVREVNHLLYFDTRNFEGTRKALNIEALSPGWRGSFEERLEKADLQYDLNKRSRESNLCCSPQPVK